MEDALYKQKSLHPLREKYYNYETLYNQYRLL